MKFEQKNIIEACGKSSFSRGQEYHKSGRVLSLDYDAIKRGVELIGRTLGSGGNIYNQKIHIDFQGGYIEIEGQCDCPVNFNCKHVVAVCLEYKSEIETPSLPSKSVTEQIAKPEIPEQDKVSRWLQNLTESAVDFRSPMASQTKDWLVFILRVTHDNQSLLKPRELSVSIRATHQRKNGTGLVKGREIALHNIDDVHCDFHALPIDSDITAFLQTTTEYSYWNTPATIRGRAGASALTLMLESGRCYWQNSDGSPIHKGEEIQLQLNWEAQENGELALQHNLGQHCLLLNTHPVMYLDTKRLRAGQLDVQQWSQKQLIALSQAPQIPADEAETVTQQLLQSYPRLSLPLPAKIDLRNNDGKVINPCLTLTSIENIGQSVEHCVLLDFDYNGDRVSAFPFNEQSTFSSQGDWIRLTRNNSAEESAVSTLIDYGFQLCEPTGDKPQSLRLVPMGITNIASGGCWAEFVELGIDVLRDAGWEIDIDEQFHLSFEDADWEAEVDEEVNDNDWFSLRFDLKVGDKSLPLAPLLTPLLALDPADLPEVITLPIEQHRYLRLPYERIQPFLSTLQELFSRQPGGSGSLRISRFDAISIDQLAEQGAAIRGADNLRQLAKQMKDFDGIKAVELPDGLNAELRPYQQSGLNWLQFLREYRFAGILADDMGLGKTVQTLAHLLVEKNAGRLDKPALVVAPTSLMGNWRREAERFTPELRVIVLHGTDRHQFFDEIENCDLLLTTYPLLSRDSEQLQAQHYHSIILDEAQAIKNPNTKMAKLVRQLPCDHRLCLTGTPMENHLGELWSLFDFLMPGFLGDSNRFKKFYRTPIEVHGDLEKQQKLAQRVQPFLLRREKDEVASELPPKTEILQTVELEGKQAELYESIRLAMDKRVREAIKTQGLGRSHITILDALLKLRQVCCDPRLLKLDQAKNVTQSAKLELLMDILPEQLEEGRRIILFSQFTSMLALIEDELQKHNIEYSKLTGQTLKRDEAIQRFREGHVNLFLISLKAGGTGLNLTEADTVILYDPWWNPAVEAQAIDRAHRIGQDKPVFIYRLMVAGSVEEKMLAMQDKKRSLAKGIYSVKSKDETPLLDTHTLQNLFSPLGSDI